MTDAFAPSPPPLPSFVGGPQAWEDTSPIDPQPQLQDPPSPPPPIVPPKIWASPDDGHIGGIPEPDDEFDLEDEPSPEDVAMAKAKAKYASKKTRITHRAAQFARGEITVKDLDDEELKRGRFRDSDGKFRGRSASKIPAAFHEEVMRRLLERGAETIRQDYLGAIDTITDIMYDDTLDASVRLRAADMIMTRVAGKAPEKVELTVAVKPWEQTLKGIIKAPPLELGVIDATIVGDDDDDEDGEDNDSSQ